FLGSPYLQLKLAAVRGGGSINTGRLRPIGAAKYWSVITGRRVVQSQESRELKPLRHIDKYRATKTNRCRLILVCHNREKSGPIPRVERTEAAQAYR
ncbi:hypothetical protein J6590_019054, partial [Homalodisca vitripennis]